MPLERLVKVQTQRVTAGSKPKDSVMIHPIRISLGSVGEEVVWQAIGRDITVEFDKGPGPFPAGVFPLFVAAGQKGHSGPCQSVAQTIYAYSITVSATADAPEVKIDPEVDVSDNTPPPKPGAPQPFIGVKRTPKKHPPTKKKTK
jgi:hypothetical protein